jgi:TRAP-type C4-dicarboxylate transport system permease small subunit
MDVLDRAIAFFSRCLVVIGAVLLAGMMLLACANMVFRAFGMPIMGTYELMGYLSAVVVAFGLASTQREGGHIALTLLAGRLPVVIERLIDAVSQLACTVFFGLIALKTSEWATYLMESGEYSETLQFAYYPFPFAVAAGCGVLALTLFLQFLRSLFALGGAK